MARAEDRQKAIRMRREGKTYNEIQDAIGVPKSTLSGWLSGLTVSDKAASRIADRKKKHIQRITKRVWTDKERKKASQSAKKAWKNDRRRMLNLSGRRERRQESVGHGSYVMALAPPGYPGKIYRNESCYKHHLVYWLNTGVVPKSGEVIHHKNGDTKDNAFENLELMTRAEHARLHAEDKGVLMVAMECPWCKSIFERKRNQTHLVIKRKKSTSCSRRCAALGRGIPTKIIKEYRKHGDRSLNGKSPRL